VDCGTMGGNGIFSGSGQRPAKSIQKALLISYADELKPIEMPNTA